MKGVSFSGIVCSDIGLKKPEASLSCFPVNILIPIDTADADSANLSVLCRPWIRSKDPQIPVRGLARAERYYKVYAILGLGLQFIVRMVTVLDIGAGPKLVLKSLLLPFVQLRIRTDASSDYSDTNHNPLRMAGMVTLVVRCGTSVAQINFIACRKLAARDTLGCIYRNRFVGAVRLRLKHVEPPDRSSVSTVCRPLKRVSRDRVPLHAAREPTPASRAFTKLRVAALVSVPTETRVWVQVNSRQHRPRVLQPLASFMINPRLR